MEYLSVPELFELTLSHPKTQETLQQYNINMDKYIKIINNFNIGSKLQISTYDDYINAVPKLFPVFRKYISETEYTALMIFKPQIDAIVFNIFKDLIV